MIVIDKTCFSKFFGPLFSDRAAFISSKKRKRYSLFKIYFLKIWFLLAQRFNINIATVEELKQVPRIGTETARKIIELRIESPFKNVDDLNQRLGTSLEFPNVEF